MSYIETQKARKFRLMREAKERKRMESVNPEPFHVLPELRKTIVITNYDFDEEVHKFELLKTGRINQYRVLVDGEEWKQSIGLSGILAGIRKSIPAVRSMY